VAFVLSGEEKYDEAIRLAEETVALNPEVYKSQYQLGIVYSLYADASENIGKPVQEEYRLKARNQFTLAWKMAKEQNRYQFFLFQDYSNLISIYRVLGDNSQAAEVLEEALKAYPKEQRLYIDAMAIYRDLRDKDRLIEVAGEAGRIFPEIKKETETIVQLAEQGRWDILDTF
jgi:tetratricopeptide (TPR) repeat protein